MYGEQSPSAISAKICLCTWISSIRVFGEKDLKISAFSYDMRRGGYLT